MSAPATAATTANVVMIPSSPPNTIDLMYSLGVLLCASGALPWL